ncbi:AAA family ATPase [Anaerocolumna xylanovorans]|uniref:AAA domain-containing protein n=1 Tax=Anaerocolumna xylanovorans DSM 12503 TaxID=1121345 RepID=A0A1M7Y1Z2_9FIRM|nr:AAA family ATPase [Anaerocolumna xylanovorans]SHO45850.1 hypothetical protein SAMN02745217_01085 [Anaerocolumna xylanovorans DSM 12503]
MKRKLIAQLENWKDSSHKRTLILSGAKGTGKTYLALAFANTYYDSYTYLNLENNPVNLESILQAGKDDLAAFFTCILTKNRKELPLCEAELSESHLFLLDEITYPGNFEIFIEYLKKQFPAADILAISSTERDVLKKAFIQWDYQYLTLRPLDFEEFLMATGNEWYIEVIKEQYRNGIIIPDIVHKELLELLEDYLYVGGLPIAVNEYVTTGGKENITEIHRNILSSYLFEAGIQKGDGCGLKVKQILYSLPKQLSKRNKKFQYALIRKGATETLYMEGHSHLKNTCFGIYNTKITEEELENFMEGPGTLSKNAGMKMYLFDIGLYHSLSRIAGTDKGEEFRSGLLESYTAQALYAAGIDFGYWESSSMLHSLFLLKDREISRAHVISSASTGKVLPLEVKEAGANRSKSLSSFHEKHPAISHAIKVSSDNKAVNGLDNRKINFPLYCIFCFGL